MSNRRYNLRPLPGGRRGTPGAVAGCLSMRSNGDEELSRRAPVDKSTTAEDHPEIDTLSLLSSGSSSYRPETGRDSPTSSEFSAFEDVAQEVQSAVKSVPTSNDQPKRRRWTAEMNIFILRSYLEITALETDTNRYLDTLYKNFIKQYPHFEVTRQRLGDQRRAIINNKLIPQTKIDKVYREVQDKINQTHPTQQTQPGTVSALNTNNSQPLRQRICWTNNHNETIMKIYYKITELETNKTAYRRTLHQQFINIFPELSHVTEQRIADQRRLIVNNKKISSTRLNEIREEVTLEIRPSNVQNLNSSTYSGQYNTTLNRTNDPSFNVDSSLSTSDTILPLTYISFDKDNIQNILGDADNSLIETVKERDANIDNTFQEALQFYTDTDPTNRNYIPKQKSTKKLARIVNYVNEVILPEHINDSSSYNTLQTVLYCAAWTAAKINGTKLTLATSVVVEKPKQQKPKWQRRLEAKIEDLRVKIGRLTHYINGNRGRKLTRHINKILNDYKVHTTHEENNTKLPHFLDTLKQKLGVLNSRLTRYLKCTLRKTQNQQFTNNEKQFYRKIKNTNLHDNTQPTSEASLPPAGELRDFWANIWERPIQHDTEAEWVTSEKQKCSHIDAMEFDSITLDMLKNVIERTHNWKATGSDHIHNYWYKKYTYIHTYLHHFVNVFISNPDRIPKYITAGVTYMIPKDKTDTTNPAKYRPITCLQTIYKIITSCLATTLYKYLDTHNILTEQQKGCKKNSRGCKEQLTIDSIILKQVKKYKTNLFTMYIDYKKAYDSVPHSWLLHVLSIYKIHPTIIQFLDKVMQTWTTQLKINTDTGTLNSDTIQIKRGIFQGDALSPLWFCLALNPLSNNLNTKNLGYKLKQPCDSNTPIQKITHLMYMDDIKLYASTETDLYELANTTESFSKDINMDFGIDKCKINSIKNGHSYRHDYQLDSGDIITSLDQSETYKYLGYNQSNLIDYRNTKEYLTKQFRIRLNAILTAQLNARNTIKAINSYAIPILTYSFGIINWSRTELKSLQRTINTSMTKHRKHHPRSCVQRLTLAREHGGRGLIDILNLHAKQITNLRAYFHTKSETSTLYKTITQNDTKLTPLNLNDLNTQLTERQTDRQTKLQDWMNKSLHGRHLQDLYHINVDSKASNEWLKRGELFPETEGFLMAIQDQVIETRNYQKYIMKLPNLQNDGCRRCNSGSETIQHITGACKAIVQTDYKHRHDQVANIIHQSLAQKYKLTQQPPIPYYKYNPETILENSTHKLYFDRAILTDRTVHYNRPDVTLIDKINKTAHIIDIAVPNTHNLQKTIAEKLTKYIELKDEITKMWKLNKVSIIPVVLSTTGVIPIQLVPSLRSLGLPDYTYTLLQKASILNTCRIVRKFLEISHT